MVQKNERTTVQDRAPSIKSSIGDRWCDQSEDVPGWVGKIQPDGTLKKTYPSKSGHLKRI